MRRRRPASGGDVLADRRRRHILAALGGGVSAIGATATAEQFSDAVRLSGLALGATTATALFGGAAPYVVHTLQKLTGIAEIPGIVIAAVAACIGLTLAILLPHPRGSAAPDHRDPA